MCEAALKTMNSKLNDPGTYQQRHGERGAALITVLLMSVLLLAAGGALILTTVITATNAIDATGESQAYFSSEAGLQAALNVMRGNVAPNPAPTPAPGATPIPVGQIGDHLKINFRRAVTRYNSNHPSDSNAMPMRLSRWLPYMSGDYSDRVAIGDPATYSPLNSMAYSVEVEDPDDSAHVAFSTAGEFSCGGSADCTLVSSDTIRFNDATGQVTIRYIPNSGDIADAYPTVTSNLGRFEVTANGIPVNLNSGARFTLTINQTEPWEASTTFQASISGTMLAATSNLRFNFAYTSATAGEARYKLDNSASNLVILHPAQGQTILNVTITPPDPRRLLIRSTGYGPRGSQKSMAMMLDRAKFDLDPPAPIVIRGADPTAAGSTPAEIVSFDLGSSNAKHYSGTDLGGIDAPRPTVAISLYDWNKVDEGVKKGATVGDPEVSILNLDDVPSPWPSPTPARLQPAPATSPPSVVTPDWLETADKARVFLMEMEALARGTDVTTATPNGRYITGPWSGAAGSTTIPKITFVDGNCTLDGGAGLLIVTGTLTLTGNNEFKGIILVLGEGVVTRSGGGGGDTEGSWIVARFIRNPTVGQNRNFLAPNFDVSGGGNSDFDFNSKWVKTANNLLGGRVRGVVEYNEEF